MKRLIAGVFLIQILIIIFLGIPAGGAADAVWRDQDTGITVSQGNPADTIKSFYRLVENDGYNGAALLFSEEGREYLNGDLLNAYYQSNGFNEAVLTGVYSSNIIGNHAMVGAISLLETENQGIQPLLALYALRETGGKWEITQESNNTDINEIKQIYERALEVCTRISDDPLTELNDEQKQNILMQVEMGKQVLTGNLEQINQMIGNK